MIVSKNEVCNMALSRLKVEPIVDIDSPNRTEVERLLALWYDTSRGQVLRAHPWNFAKDRALISLSTEAPAFGYPNKYKLPTDYLRLRFIGEENLGLIGIDYQIEGRYMLIDNAGGASLQIGYVKDITNVALFDALALLCFSLTLANNIAYGIVGKNVLKKEVKQDLKDANAEAKAINGQDNPPKRITRSSVLAARRKYSSGSTLGLRNVDDLLV